MMRKPYLLSCYATASSLTSPRRVHGFSRISCQPPTPMSAFTHRPSSTGGAVKKHSRNQYHTQRESFHCTSREMIWTRHFGSKSMQQQFLKTTKTKGRANDEDNGEDLERDDDDDEEEEEAVSHNNYQPTDNVIKSRTLDWIKKVVIGYNLCPFAERPLREDKLKVSVVRGSDDEYVASAVVYELIARSEESQSGTTVVVAPEYYPDDFVGYMNLVQWIEDNIFDEHELDGLVQIAPFHPKFEFAGSGKEGIDNFTNRSPYPMFHILREDEVGGAVEKLGGDASKVWSRNVRLLESMEEKWGAVGVEKAMRGEPMDGMDALLKEMKLSDRDNDRD